MSIAYHELRMKKTSHPTVAIVGTGNVARAMAVALHYCGVQVTEIVGRDAKKAAELARQVKARPATLSDAKLEAKIVWICVSDRSIRQVASQLSKLPVRWSGKTALHASGPLTSSELSPLRARGANVASFHPMNSFSPLEDLYGRASVPAKLQWALVRGTPFGAEGDTTAIRAARKLVTPLAEGGSTLVFRIRPKDKVLYHAIGAFTAPLLASTLNIAERIAKSIGIKQPELLMQPILSKTATNFSRGGSSGAFSGPIRRGDVATIRRHLAALSKVPGAKDVYRALALNAVEHLPAKNQAELRKLLKRKRK